MAEKKEFSRREFMKIAGAGAGVALAGCGRDLPEKLIPYVIQPDEIIPGVAAWYSGTCFECAGGCGLLARTREGRVVKLEGNPVHPINRGGLCARGQSALQTLYDPDRVREPLERRAEGMAPVSWEAALAALAQAVSQAGAAGKQTVLITGSVSLSEAALIKELGTKLPGLRHIVYDLLEDYAHASAAEAIFGQGAAVRYDFSAAELVVGFGADYLGTWLSPVAHARDLSKAREISGGKRLLKRVVHFEPRLSLTAANADHWFCSAPGAEEAILQHLLAAVLRHRPAPPDLKGIIDQLLSAAPAVSLPQSGVSPAELEAIAAELAACGASLVIAGGPALGASAARCALFSHVMNAVLGNVGKTLILSASSGTLHDGTAELGALAAEIEQRKTVGVVITAGCNPAFTLSQQSGFQRALRRVSLVCSLAFNLDETAQLARFVLPLSTSLESWRDAEPYPGVFCLNQPAMQPLYPSQSLADTLLALAAADPLKQRIGEVQSFYDYLRLRWRERIGEANFDERWLRMVEAGGEFRAPAPPPPALRRPLPAGAESGKEAGLTLLAYPTVSLGDGSAANRPWAQEAPDPITSAVWGSWLEIHPQTAQKHGIGAGDAVRVTLPGGSFEAPAYLTSYIHPETVAVPLGQGHQRFGRYADGIGTNPLAVLEAKQTGGQFKSGVVRLERVAGKGRLRLEERLVLMQGSDSQHGRGFVRTAALAEVSQERSKAESGHASADAHREGGEKHREMYEQHDHAPYHWGMSIDLDKCNGCSACVVACYAENNVPVAGKQLCAEGRDMAWLQVHRFLDGPAHRPVLGFIPMLCQHCANAPCEPVCPVYATYHNPEGLNAMVYNRCVGTRYCANNCSYKVRRFNWVEYSWPEPLNWQLNPDVAVRSVGVMEKCTFCIQRIRAGENRARDEGRLVRAEEIQPACASSCPAGAIKFGDLNNKQSSVYQHSLQPRAYRVLDLELNTKPAITYLSRVLPDDKKNGQGSGHGG